MATLLKLSETRWLHTDTVTLIRQEGEQGRVWRGRAPHMPGAPPAPLGEQECFDDRPRSSLGRLRDWNLPQAMETSRTAARHGESGRCQGGTVQEAGA